MTEKHKAILGSQESFCQKALTASRWLASQLVDEKGALIREPVKLKSLFSIEGTSDHLILERQQVFLDRWKKDAKFFNSFKKFSLPLCHKGAEKLVRESIGLSTKKKLTDAHVKQAVLSACVMILRQTVGSCFATAPAILIQEEHLDLFVQDIYNLLTQGTLKRVIRGVQYSAPLNLKGVFLDNHALLKSWEFTLASLSEAKRDVPRWNIYLSLGLDLQESGGLGEVLYNTLNEKLSDINKKIDEFDRQAESALGQYNFAKSLLNQASSESDARRLQAECSARYHHFQSLCDLKNDALKFGKHISILFSFLIKKYAEKIPFYFQEVYDPDMAELSSIDYEDTPAGFRLVYKYGRVDASLWTSIYTSDEFIAALVDFFTLTENEIAHEFEEEAEKKSVLDATSVIISHVRSDEFLQKALERASKQKRTPWSYLSGGTMDSLLMVYFSKEALATQESKWVESPLELLIFLVDTVKNLSHLTTDLFSKNAHKRLLMQSPVHAFSLQPGKFKQAWQNSSFTYTWIRDNFLLPNQNFYAGMLLSSKEQETLLERISSKINPQGLMQVGQFYNFLVENNVSRPASLLYRSLPLTPREECQAALQDILKPWTDRCELPHNLPSYLTSEELCLIAKMNLAKQKFTNLDIHLAVIQRAQELNLAPKPFLFADTNWVDSYFGFVVNPGTGVLELWRLDRTGQTGSPMTSWTPWLSGSEKLPWVIYTS